MHRARIHRIASVAAVAGLLAGLLPGVVLAALPNAVVTNDVLVPDFEPGGTTAFSSEFFFDEPSGTLSKLVATLDVTGYVTPPTPYLRSYIDGASAGTCSTSELTCTFRNVRAQERVLIVLGVQSAGPLVTASFVWESVGAGNGAGDQSHGDTWIDEDGAAVTASASTDGNYGGGFGLASSWSLKNDQALTATNRQAARLNGLAHGIIATVEDGPNATSAFVCVSNSSVTCPTNWIGEAVDVHVDGGNLQGTLFEIVITYPNGTPSPKQFIHVTDEGTAESIVACPKRNPTSGAPCFTWSAKTNQATIYTYQNGGFRA